VAIGPFMLLLFLGAVVAGIEGSAKTLALLAGGLLFGWWRLRRLREGTSFQERSGYLFSVAWNCGIVVGLPLSVVRALLT
jgi:hypothetical protein